MILNTAMVSVATAFVGVIGFMGLIVPHILRLILGSDNKNYYLQQLSWVLC